MYLHHCIYLYVYTLDSSIPQGYCIIINNNSSYYEEDRIREMKEIFGGQLGFHVQVYSDCARTGIVHLLSTVASTDHTVLQGLVVILLSKGKKRVVYGSDGKKLTLNELIMLFSHNFSLANIPKLFFVDGQLDNEKVVSGHPIPEIPSHTCLFSCFEPLTEQQRDFMTMMRSVLHKGVGSLLNCNKVLCINNLTAEQCNFSTITER